MTHPILARLHELGQSIWLDNLTRTMIREGRLKSLVEQGVSGVTSNPAIFRKAIGSGTDYDADIRKLSGKSALEIYEALAVRDIRDACDALRPAYEASNGTDGYVSLEVNPHLARDTEGTVREAFRLWNDVGKENLLVKIPGTPEGVPAVRECLKGGVNVNITLLFSLDAHRAVMEAHLEALEARHARREPMATVASVASFFLSRIDTMVDAKLGASPALRGLAAVASAKLAYKNWKETYSGERWERLRAAGARVQKPLWASTSTKDPAYPDLKYVEPLIGPQTINTVPDETLEALLDHGRPAPTVEEGAEAAKGDLERLERAGISIAAVTDALVEEGIAKFIQPFDALLAEIEEKRRVTAR